MAQAFEQVLERVAQRAQDAGVFGSVEVRDGRLECAALASAEPAFYRVERDERGVWVSLVTANRWLSESIESDLMHTGDKLDELIDEEFAETGWEHGRATFEHFRSDDMLFTFRTPIPLAADDPKLADAATAALLGYEQCFRALGDMEADEDDE